MSAESSPYNSAEPTGFPSYLRSRNGSRNVPDVPEDVDFIMEHLNDPNFDLRKPMHSVVGPQDLEGEKQQKGYAVSDLDTDSHMGSEPYARPESRNSTAIDFDDESPYPEVRAAVSSVDDPTMPVNTFRTWFLGIIFAILIPGCNHFFNARYPAVYITGIVAQLITLPLGKALELVLPTYRFRIFGKTFSLNPGPFNIKEHVCITVMGNMSVQGAYATEVIAAQRLFYNQTPPIGYQILLIVGTQIVGFSLGGALRSYVVWPSSMIWPGALVNSALFNTLHKNYGKSDAGHMSRERFFCLAALGAFVWFWFPGYIFMALSVFNWVCWIAPTNVTINVLFGTQSGLGMSMLTFDWAMISYLTSPLVTPWWAELNAVGCIVVLYWILAPALYFTNTWFSGFLPVTSTRAYDNTGARYNASAVVTDGIFDSEKYRQYSPIYLPVTLALAYGRDFALFPAVVVHTLLWFRRDIVKRFRGSLKNERDIHSRLMQAYPEVPSWWYWIVGVVSIVFLLVAIEIFPTQLPIWAALFAIAIAAITCVPLAMLQAITNQQITLQVMHELIIGYILPERPIANSIFKGLALTGSTQAVTFAGDLKLGHYMKIPPRMMFMVQLVSAIIGCFVVIGVQEWMFANIPDFCMPGQKDNFICPGTNLFATASLIWGGIGPQRMFTEGIYQPLLYFFLIGALLPIPFYFLALRFPLSFWRYVNIPVALGGAALMPPASGNNYLSWAIIGFIFNYFIRRFHFRWWMRYNYLLSAALDSGTAFAIIIIFFALMYNKGLGGFGIYIDWWGNTVFQKTLDAEGARLHVAEDGQVFGPTIWA